MHINSWHVYIIQIPRDFALIRRLPRNPTIYSTFNWNSIHIILFICNSTYFSINYLFTHTHTHKQLAEISKYYGSCQRCFTKCRTLPHCATRCEYKFEYRICMYDNYASGSSCRVKEHLRYQNNKASMTTHTDGIYTYICYLYIHISIYGWSKFSPLAPFVRLTNSNSKSHV